MVFGAVAVGFACALLSYVYLLITDPDYNRGGDYTFVILFFAFIVGLQITNVFTTPLSSGIDTIFVAAGWNPEILRSYHPDLFEEIVRSYPQVAIAMHA
jgi:hypothetical protein